MTDSLRPALTLHGAYGQISTGAFVDDATLVVASGAYLHLVDAASGRVRRSAIERDATRRVAVSADGGAILTCSRMGKLAIRRALVLEARESIDDPRTFSQIAIDDVARFAVTSEGNTGVIVDLERASVACELVGHLPQIAQERGVEYDAAFIYAVAIAGDGTAAITGATDERAIVWDTTTGAARMVLAGHTDSVRDVAIDATADTAVTIDLLGALRIWDARTGAQLLAYRFPAQALRARFDRSGERLAAVLADGTLATLERRGAGVAQRWQPTHTYATATPYAFDLDLSFDRSGATVAIASAHNRARTHGWLDDSLVSLVSLDSGAVREVRVAGTHVPAVGFADATATRTAVVPVARPVCWDLAGEGEPQRLDGWPALASAAVGETGDRCVAIGDDATLGVYDVAGQCVARIHPSARPMSYAVSGDGKRIAALYDEREIPVTIEFYAIDGTYETMVTVGENTRIVGFAGDGCLIVATRDDIVGFEPPTWKARFRIVRTVGGAAVSRAGDRLFVAFSDEPIAAYDTVSGTRVGSFDDAGRVNGGVFASADGRYFATDGDGGIHIFSLMTKRLVASVDGLIVDSTAREWVFSRDGSRALVNVGNEYDGGCATLYDLRDVVR